LEVSTHNIGSAVELELVQSVVLSAGSPPSHVSLK
jgi:hypothetical protein